MSNKINIDKINGFSPIRATGENDVKKSGDQKTKPIVVNNVIDAKLEFSNRATEVGKYVEQIKNLPDVREAKVSQIREQISSGNFNPSGESIADAILKDEKI